MGEAFQFQSRTGDDGSLNLHLNLGRSEASKDVLVTVQALGAETPSGESWSHFLARTYGSCADVNLSRPDQGRYEQREPLE